jgi:hypothetical protein
MDFNGLTGVADVSLWTIMFYTPFSTWMFVMEFNGLNYRGGRVFIDSGARYGFLQPLLPSLTHLCINSYDGCGF